MKTYNIGDKVTMPAFTNCFGEHVPERIGLTVMTSKIVSGSTSQTTSALLRLGLPVRLKAQHVSFRRLKMYVITYKNRPITLERLYALDNDVVHDYNEDEMFLTAPSLAKIKALYIHYRGFTWAERNKGIEAKKVRV